METIALIFRMLRWTLGLAWKITRIPLKLFLAILLVNAGGITSASNERQRGFFGGYGR